MIWLVFAAMTAIALGGALWPLWRGSPIASAGEQPAASQAALAIYEARLAEIDRDVGAGAATPDDAKASKAEAARILIAESRENRSIAAARPHRLIAASVACCAALAAAGLYMRLGHPDEPDQPLSAQNASPGGGMDMATAMAKIENHLAAEPNDARGWAVVAPVYLRVGRAEDAARAYANLLRLEGESPARRTDYAEALIYGAQGVVTTDARKSLDMAVAADPKFVKARFYLGLAAEQDGDKARAKDIWTRLASEAPPESTFAKSLQERIAKLDGAAGAAADPAVNSPPSAKPDASQDMAKMAPEDRSAFIRSMVERLAERLHEQNGTVDEWLRLVRAYRVLDETDKARAALGEARKAYSADAAALGKLDALARELGIGS